MNQSIAWGSGPHQYWFDRILAKVALPFIPRFVKPNHLTAARFLATPFVVWWLANGIQTSGIILFLLVAFTDALDGSLARVRNQVTEWGKLFDPLADKLLICSVVFVLVLKYVDPYAAGVIIVLEALIVISALVKKWVNSSANIQANVWGKIKMVLQVTGVLIMLLSIIFQLDTLLVFSKGSFYLAIAFAIISLFTYSI